MTERELYELLGEAKISFEFDQKNDSFYGLKGDIKIRFSDLADFINDYFLPRPLFEDGTPVKVGDEFALHKLSDSEKIIDYCVCDDGSFAINNFRYDQGQRVMKPEEKPDSWEQLEKDAILNPYNYCCLRNIDSEHGFAQILAGKDLIRRAKALAGVKDE